MDPSIYAFCLIMGTIFAFLFIGMAIDFINKKRKAA